MQKVYRSSIQCDVPSSITGRVYSRTELEGAIVKFNGREVRFGMLESINHHHKLVIDMERVSHEVTNVHIDDDGFLCASIKFLDSTYGNIAEGHSDSMELTPKMWGTVSPTAVVTDLSFITFNLAPLTGRREEADVKVQ